MSEEITPDTLIDKRYTTYGLFTENARISQGIKAVLRNCSNWPCMDPDQHEALEMIAVKMGRIINGDPDYADSWDDIAGYAKLVADRLRGNAR